MNTYYVSGYYVTDDERNGQSFSEIVLAKGLEESIAIFRSLSQYRNAVINEVMLGSRDIIVGKGGGK